MEPMGGLCVGGSWSVFTSFNDPLSEGYDLIPSPVHIQQLNSPQKTIINGGVERQTWYQIDGGVYFWIGGWLRVRDWHRICPFHQRSRTKELPSIMSAMTWKTNMHRSPMMLGWCSVCHVVCVRLCVMARKVLACVQVIWFCHPTYGCFLG